MYHAFHCLYLFVLSVQKGKLYCLMWDCQYFRSTRFPGVGAIDYGILRPGGKESARRAGQIKDDFLKQIPVATLCSSLTSCATPDRTSSAIFHMSLPSMAAELLCY
jgi:hypothetical protein